jgi:hypothetical protein
MERMEPEADFGKIMADGATANPRIATPGISSFAGA